MILEYIIYILKYLKSLTNPISCFSILLYFNSRSLRALVKNAIGCSKHSLFFQKKIIAIVSSNAMEKIKNSLSKSRLIRIGASFNSCLILSKEFIAYFDHLTSQTFFNIHVMSLTIFAKLGINLLRKIIFPQNN